MHTTNDEWFVYKLTHKVSNKGYIGIAKNPRKRWRRHISAARSGVKTAIGAAIRKYGSDGFRFEIIVEAVNFREAAAIERGLIASHRTLSPHGYNLSTGGEATLGRELSAESRAKMSASAKARVRQPVTDETKKKQSAARTAVLRAKPHLRRAIGDFNRGRERTPEQRAMISMTLKDFHGR